MTVMGFDFGLKRTGVAIANRVTGVATPQAVLYSQNGQPDWPAIKRLIAEWHPDTLVVGMPSKLDGSVSAMHDVIKAFAANLNQRTGLPVLFTNEQLSSQEAEQRLKQTRQLGRKRKIRKEEIDQMAAVIVLENWLQEQAR